MIESKQVSPSQKLFTVSNKQSEKLTSKANEPHVLTIDGTLAQHRLPQCLVNIVIMKLIC